MAANTITRGRLRRLAELHPDRGLVLSVFFNLDPSEFATPAARATEVNSVITAAAHKVDEAEGLDGASARRCGQTSSACARCSSAPTWPPRARTDSRCSRADRPDLLEVVRLPHPIASRAIVDDRPCVEPLVRNGAGERWCVLLVNRRTARIFLGQRDGLEEVDQIAGRRAPPARPGRLVAGELPALRIEQEKLNHLGHALDDAVRALQAAALRPPRRRRSGRDGPRGRGAAAPVPARAARRPDRHRRRELVRRAVAGGRGRGRRAITSRRSSARRSTAWHRASAAATAASRGPTR